METKELTCTRCPLGCNLKITINGEKINVTGNNCINGEKYAIDEITNPQRIVTSIIKTNKNNYVSCKTDRPVPKSKIFDVVKEIKKVTVKEPIKIKDILIENVCGLGVNVIATKNI